MQVIYYGLKNYIYQLVTPLQKPGSMELSGAALSAMHNARCCVPPGSASFPHSALLFIPAVL